MSELDLGLLGLGTMRKEIFVLHKRSNLRYSVSVEQNRLQYMRLATIMIYVVKIISFTILQYFNI